MKHTTRPIPVAMVLSLALGALFAAPGVMARKPEQARLSAAEVARGYPTADRVVYVQQCMRDHPGNHYEMINKCSCALDEITTQVRYEDFTGMATAANAMSIGGERGGTMRDSEGMQGLAKRYRELQLRVKKACFVIPPG